MTGRRQPESQSIKIKGQQRLLQLEWHSVQGAIPTAAMTDKQE